MEAKAKNHSLFIANHAQYFEAIIFKGLLRIIDEITEGFEEAANKIILNEVNLYNREMQELKVSLWQLERRSTQALPKVLYIQALSYVHFYSKIKYLHIK